MATGKNVKTWPLDLDNGVMLYPGQSTAISVSWPRAAAYIAGGELQVTDAVNPPAPQLPGGSSVSSSAPTIVPPGQFGLVVSSAPGSPTTLTIPASATYAVITADPTNAGNIRWTWEATSPTATLGQTLAPGDTYEFANIAALKLFAESAGDKVQVTYEHY